MPANNSDSIWQSIDAFRETARNQINQGIEAMRHFSQWAGNTLSTMKNSVLRGISWAYQTLQNLPQILRNASITAWTKLVQGFHFGGRFMRWLGNFTMEFLRNLPEIARWLYNSFPAMFDFLKNLVVAVLRNLKAIALSVGRAIKHVSLNLPRYFSQMLSFAKDLLIAAKTIVVYLYQNALPLLRAGLNVVGRMLKDIGKRLLLGLGMVYGISSVLIEGMANGFSRLINNRIGFNLSENHFFNSLQTVFSVALTGALLLGALSFSFLSVAFLFPLSLLHHEETAREQAQEMAIPRQTENVEYPQDVVEEQDALLEQRQAPIVHQFEDSRAVNNENSGVVSQREQPLRRRSNNLSASVIL